MQRRHTKKQTFPAGRVAATWTTRQLRAYIRKKTKESESRIKKFEKEKVGGISDFIGELQTIAGTKPRKGKRLGLGLSYKKKTELLTQARMLEKFESFAIDKQERHERARKAWRTFKQRYHKPNLTFKKWQEMANTLGDLGDEALGTFSYMASIETLQSRTGKTVNLIKLYEKADKKIKKTQEYKNALREYKIHFDAADKEGAERYANEKMKNAKTELIKDYIQEFLGNSKK